MNRLRTLIGALLICGAAITPASAADGFRYWSYWQYQDGQWEYAKLGPAMLKASDGAVDGWRYGVGSTTTSTPPSVRTDFDTVCGATEVSAGEVRVAIVIDFGEANGAPAPRTACAVLANGLSRASALSAVAGLRLDQGFVCAIDAYPATGCGEPVDEAPQPAPSTTSRPTPATTPSVSAAPGVPLTTDSALPAPQIERSPEPASDEGSVVPTIVTMVLALIALVVALRNARLQQEMRRK